MSWLENSKFMVLVKFGVSDQSKPLDSDSLLSHS